MAGCQIRRDRHGPFARVRTEAQRDDRQADARFERTAAAVDQGVRWFCHGQEATEPIVGGQGVEEPPNGVAIGGPRDADGGHRSIAKHQPRRR